MRGVATSAGMSFLGLRRSVRSVGRFRFGAGFGDVGWLKRTRRGGGSRRGDRQTEMERKVELNGLEGIKGRTVLAV